MVPNPRSHAGGAADARPDGHIGLQQLGHLDFGLAQLVERRVFWLGRRLCVWALRLAGTRIRRGRLRLKLGRNPVAL